MGYSGNARTDLKEMQTYYDLGYTEDEVCAKFKVSPATLHRAKKRGDFKSRGKSEGLKIAHKKCPRKHSEETKKKISAIRIKYLTEHPDKVPYLLNHYSKGDSYPEKYFEALFKKENIPLQKKMQIGLYQLDFYNLDKKIDLEIDGEQHHVDLRIRDSDLRRNKWLEDLGWKVYRIRWSDYQKMNRQNKEIIINEIKNLLSGL